MNEEPIVPDIPSFPFHDGKKSVYGMVKNVLSMLRGKANMWENGRIAVIDVPLDAGEAGKLLPVGLRLQESGTAHFCIADYEKTSFTVPYRECFLLIPVRSRVAGAGVHCPWMIVNDDSALIYGRELLAYPKKMGTIMFTERDGVISARTDRRGVTLASAHISLKDPVKDPGPVTAVKVFNTGGMGQFLSFNPVWLFRFAETVHEVRSGEARLEIGDSPCDPIRKLLGDVSGLLPARVARVDIHGWRYMLPVGVAGPWNFANTFEYRFR